MKVPNIFRPEKISDEKIKSLESIKEKEIRSLTDFILNEGPYTKFVNHSNIAGMTYNRIYPSIDEIDLIDDICIIYGGNENFIPAVDILKFQNVQIMKLNLKNVVECAHNFNDKNNNIKISILVKDSYVCFAYTSGNKQKTELVNGYKKKFGFEEIKI